jgi:hypothetical protein
MTEGCSPLSWSDVTPKSEARPLRPTRLFSPVVSAAVAGLLLPVVAFGLTGNAGLPAGQGSSPTEPIAEDRLEPSVTEADGWLADATGLPDEADESTEGALVPSGLPTPAPGDVAASTAAATTSAVAGTRIIAPSLAIRLACALVRVDGTALGDALSSTLDLAPWAADGPAPAVACHWSTDGLDRIRAFQLWRAVDAPGGRPRELIATIPSGNPLRYLDRGLSPGHAYTYVVVGLGVDGVAVAVSRPVTVVIPPRLERLRLACEVLPDPASVDVVRTAALDPRGVACKWSESQNPAAAGYVLWRSVDGGPREAIYRTGLDGMRSFVDTWIRPGHVIRYAVVVVNRHGGAIGLGGPVAVRVPPPPHDAIRLDCVLVGVPASTVDARRPGVACRWSESTHPKAAVHVLWRTVDGGPREPIYRAPAGGQLRYHDAEVKPGQAIRYAVVVLDASGQQVGLGGPVEVRVPLPERLVPADGATGTR